MLAPLESAEMASFVALLDEINALADSAPGFVWRFQGDAGNATYIRPYDDDRILFNMSVWESIEALKTYTYETAHAAVLRRRREWFSSFGQSSMALWWTAAGTMPSVGDAVARLAYLQEHGPSRFAFTFRQPFDASADGLVLPGEGNALGCSAT